MVVVEMVVALQDQAKHKRNLAFLNTRVSLPILVAKQWNAGSKRAIFEDDHGLFINKPTGDKRLVRGKRRCLCMTIRVKRDLINHPRDQGFSLPGQD